MVNKNTIIHVEFFRIEPHLVLKHISYINTPQNPIFWLVTRVNSREFMVKDVGWVSMSLISYKLLYFVNDGLISLRAELRPHLLTFELTNIRHFNFCNFFEYFENLIQNNVWCNKIGTKDSSKTLLSLVRFLMHQTLHR